MGNRIPGLWMRSQQRGQFIHGFVENDNQVRLKSLNYKSPMEASTHLAGLYAQAAIP